jgi:hypothetical protein
VIWFEEEKNKNKMKQCKFLLFLVITLGVVLKVNSQITVLSSDMPTPGDTIRTSLILNLSGFDFEQTGSNFEWDYRNLVPESQRLDTFKTIQQTPVFFWPSFFTSANLAVSFDAGNLLPGFELDGAFQYFNKSTTTYRDFGYGLIIDGLPLPLKFTNPDLLYSFPMTMGNTFESEAYLEFALPEVGFLSIDRQRSNIVDGWGLLKTPYGNFDVLRLKSTVFEIDSVYIDSISQGTTIARNYIEYKWIGKGKGIPLLQVTVDQLLGSAVIYRDSIRDLTVGINEINDSSQGNVFPNPFNDELFFRFCTDNTFRIRVSLLNTYGIKVKEDQFYDAMEGCFTYRLEIPENLKKGNVYILEIEHDNKVQHIKVIAGRR